MKTTIYIIRHGESEANLQDLVGTDAPLTDKGREQAEKTALVLKDVPFEVFFCSNKIRTKQTAEIIVKGKDIPIIELPILRERNYGVYEGQQKNEYLHDLPEAFAQYNALPPDKRWNFKYYPTYESDAECASRYIIALNDILKEHAGKVIGIASHGSVMRVVLMELGILPISLMHKDIFHNAGFIKLETDGVHFTMLENQGLKIAV